MASRNNAVSSGSNPTGHPPTYGLPSQIHLLAAPTPTFIDSYLPSYLSAAMISALKDSARVAIRRKRVIWEEMEAEGLIPPGGAMQLIRGKGKGKADGENGSSGGQGVEKEIKEEEFEAEEISEGVEGRLRDIGMQVGGNIVEKLIIFKPPTPNPLETMKFICKEFFLFLYSRQIDNLRTNHRGTFVLQAVTFPPLQPLSTANGPASDLQAAKPYMVFHAAMIEGALTRLNMPCAITTESSGLPQCTFHIKMNVPPPTAAPPSAAPPVPNAIPLPTRAE